jgi:Tfp pilus assembly protein PilX
MLKLTTVDNQRGSALVVALLMLVVLTLLGIAAITTSTTEVEISGNEKLSKMAFYGADAGTETGCELLEQNIDQRNWTDNSILPNANVAVMNGSFYLNRSSDAGINPVPSDTNQDATLPLSAVNTSGSPYTVITTIYPRTNLKFVGNTRLSTGSAVQMAAGYEGKGKAAAAGGAWVIYDIRSQNQGVRNSKAMVDLQWRHVM